MALNGLDWLQGEIWFPSCARTRSVALMNTSMTEVRLHRLNVVLFRISSQSSWSLDPLLLL
uniref:Uncharacterized protein n=1 Tax=Anguilla anguilla TaxID=7936 RepID=A0A0E9V551_ANGAN